MKYIRTKDGILEKQHIHIYYGITELKGFVENDGTFVDIEKSISTGEIEEADTIEELCECIVVRNRSINKRFIYSKNAFIKRVKRNKTNTWGRDNYEDRLKYLLEYNDVYAAIWVKGEHEEPILKPVAKMNDKGELELL